MITKSGPPPLADAHQQQPTPFLPAEVITLSSSSDIDDNDDSTANNSSIAHPLTPAPLIRKRTRTASFDFLPPRPPPSLPPTSLTSNAPYILKAAQLLRAMPTESAQGAPYRPLNHDLPAWVLDLRRVMVNPDPDLLKFNEAIRSALKNAMSNILKCSKPANWDLAHPAARFVLIALRLSILAMAYAVAPPHNRPASHNAMDALSTVDTKVGKIKRLKKRFFSTTGQPPDNISQPPVFVFANLIAVNPCTGDFPPPNDLEFIIRTIQQAIALPIWNGARGMKKSVKKSIPYITLEVAMFLVNIACRADCLHPHNFAFAPKEFIYLNLFVKIPVSVNSAITASTTVKQGLAIALCQWGITDPSAFFQIITKLNIYALSERTQFIMLQALLLCHSYRADNARAVLSSEIHPTEMGAAPPLLVIWDGDNVIPSSAFLAELDAAKLWVDVHVHGLEHNKKNFNYIDGSTCIPVGTYHTVVRTGAEAADFEALYQVIQNLNVLQRRIILLVSHDESFRIMKVNIEELLGSVGVAGTRPFILNALKHLSAGYSSATDQWPYLSGPSRASVPVVARSCNEVKFWLTWARLCITGGDRAVERNYAWNGARLCHYEAVDMINSDSDLE